MELTASSGQPQLTPTSFLEDKQQPFKQVMSNITGQPVEWIEVSAKWGQQTTVLVLSQVHAPLDELPAVREKLEAAVASQTLEVQLQAIQLNLVPGTVSYTRNSTEGEAFPPPRPPPGAGQQPAPPPPGGGGQAADAGGGSSNSTTIAIVVPVVVVTVLAIAGGGTAVYMRKRRGRQAAADAAVARQERRASRQRSQAGTAAGAPPAEVGSPPASGTNFAHPTSSV